jgi:hypothetical protein
MTQFDDEREPYAAEDRSGATEESSDVSSVAELGVDEESRVDPDSVEDLGLLHRVSVDERELDEIGAEFDDPEDMVTIDGNDDPDGLGGPVHPERSRRDDAQGWDLDASQAASDEVG